MTALLILDSLSLFFYILCIKFVARPAPIDLKGKRMIVIGTLSVVFGPIFILVWSLLLFIHILLNNTGGAEK